ncbi:MAG: thiamine diphosphokinase [Clostridiales bacterium]|nr:thiamine diphosphokinase [Clostridiales bacterium]
MKAAVICNGNINSYESAKVWTERADIVISCDGGLRHCDAMGIRPNLMAGDFDSAEGRLLSEYEEKGIEIIRVPAEKDFTDCELGIREAVKRGADDITLLGCIGTRLDHTLANCHLLMIPLKEGVKAKLVDEHNIIYMTDSKISLKVKKGQTISLIPLTGAAKGIYTKGLYYSLEDGSLYAGSSCGVSNVAVEEDVEISLKEGILLVMLTRD